MQRIFITLTLLISALILTTFTKVEAATHTVSSLNDSGAGTLRDAITLATSGDTIDFVVSGSIELQSDLPNIDKRLQSTVLVNQSH